MNPLPEAGAVAAIVLAAGASQRFGTDKLLHPLELNGKQLPLIAHSLKPWLHTFEHVTVVVRPDSSDFCHSVEQVLETDALHWLECPAATSGMAASLICGVKANRKAAGWLIGLADMPRIPATIIAQVRAAIETGARLAAPFHHGRRGQPAGFSCAYYDALLTLQGDTGARSLLQHEMARIQRIETDDSGIFFDIDHPADLFKLH